MKAITKYFGEVVYEKEDLLYIPDGLFGFEEELQYLLIHFKDDDNTLLCLQSLNEPSLAFVIVNPFYIKPDFSPQISKEDMESLDLTEESEITFYAICVIQDQLAKSTVNLKCPLVINPNKRCAKQVILDDPDLSFKHSFKQNFVSGKEEK